MKKYTHYRVDLLTGLLSLNVLSACVNTRPELGMEKDNNKQQKDSAAEGIKKRTISDGEACKAIKDIEKNDFKVKSIEDWYNKGLDMNAKDPVENPLLLKAVRKCKTTPDEIPDEIVEAVKFITDKGANVNAQDGFGNTSLFEIVSCLTFAEVFAEGNTTGDEDFRQRIPENTVQEQIIDILLAKGADPSIPNLDDNSAESRAKSWSESLDIGGNAMARIIGKLNDAKKPA